MRNFKLLLTALLLTLVWGFSFSSYAWYFEMQEIASWVVHNINNNHLYSDLKWWITYCVSFDMYSCSYSYLWNLYIWYSDTSVYNVSAWWFQYKFWDYICFTNQYSYNDLYANLWGPTCDLWYSLNVINYSNSSNDCSSVESQLSSCQWNLSSCQSDLTSCTNSCDTLVSQCQSDKETLQLSYSGCIETNSSLQNYNDSLALQLQECIEQWTWFSGATIINLYDMFRSDWINDYSLPITNNIKLPYWYRGFLDDWVLAIKNIYTLENAYSFDDDSFQNWVIENFWKVFLFFMSCGLTLVFLYAIRRYFIWLKSIK